MSGSRSIMGAAGSFISSDREPSGSLGPTVSGGVSRRPSHRFLISTDAIFSAEVALTIARFGIIPSERHPTSLADGQRNASGGRFGTASRSRGRVSLRPPETAASSVRRVLQRGARAHLVADRRRPMSETEPSGGPWAGSGAAACMVDIVARAALERDDNENRQEYLEAMEIGRNLESRLSTTTRRHEVVVFESEAK